MDMLGLKETVEGLARANGVRWFGRVLGRDEESVLRKALYFTVDGQRKRGRPKQTWRKQVEEEIKTVGLKGEDAWDQGKWRNGVRVICERRVDKVHKVNPATPVNGDKTGSKLE